MSKPAATHKKCLLCETTFSKKPKESYSEWEARKFCSLDCSRNYYQYRASIKKLKTCSYCKQEKTLDNFYKESSRTDGLMNICIDCAKEYNRSRYSKVRQQSKRKREPIKYRARTLVANLLAAGKITKQPCFLCGEPDAVAHHLHYDFPDKIVWLCTKHHGEVHYEV